MKSVSNKVFVSISGLRVFKLSKFSHGWEFAEPSLVGLKLQNMNVCQFQKCFYNHTFSFGRDIAEGFFSKVDFSKPPLLSLKIMAATSGTLSSKWIAVVQGVSKYRLYFVWKERAILTKNICRCHEFRAQLQINNITHTFAKKQELWSSDGAMQADLVVPDKIFYTA